MQITEVRIRMIDTEGKMRAVASVTFDGCFVVHDIKVILGEKGVFVAMPSRKAGEGEFKDIAHPLNTETRTMVHNAVINAFNEKMRAEMQSDSPVADQIAAKLF